MTIPFDFQSQSLWHPICMLLPFKVNDFATQWHWLWKAFLNLLTHNSLHTRSRPGWRAAVRVHFFRTHITAIHLQRLQMQGNMGMLTKLLAQPFFDATGLLMRLVERHLARHSHVRQLSWQPTRLRFWPWTWAPATPHWWCCRQWWHGIWTALADGRNRIFPSMLWD